MADRDPGFMHWRDCKPCRLFFPLTNAPPGNNSRTVGVPSSVTAFGVVGHQICRSSGSLSCSMLAIGCCLRRYAQTPPFTDLGWSMWAFTCLLPIRLSHYGTVTNRSLQASGDNCDHCQHIYDLGLWLTYGKRSLSLAQHKRYDRWL